MTSDDLSTPSSGEQPPNFPQPGSQQPQGYQPLQPETSQGFYAPQQPQFSQQRGWDQQPRRGRPPGPRRQRLGSHRIRNAILGLVGVIVLIVIIASATSGGGGKTPASSNASHPAAAAGKSAAATAAPAATSAPAPSPTPSPTPTMTASEASAVQAAQSYLQTEPGFSYQGLINQLDSPDGSGFSEADATFAVNYISPSVNWNQQAADDAQNYMTTIGGFSACSMVSQLEYDDFTQAQAEYGSQSVGLGTC
jgi:hypothetical protein